MQQGQSFKNNIASLQKQMQQSNAYKMRRQESVNQPEPSLDFLQMRPDRGQAHVDRLSIERQSVVDKPMPAGGRPKPALRNLLPKARVIYSYQAADTDEMSIQVDEIVQIIYEGKMLVLSFF